MKRMPWPRRRAARKILWPVLAAAALLAARPSALAGTAAPQPGTAAPQPLGRQPWVLTAGTHAPERALVSCVPAAGGAAEAAAGAVVLQADRSGVCASLVTFSYPSRMDLQVLGADIDGMPCHTNTWYVGCPVRLALGQQAVITTEVQAGPYARDTAQVVVRGVRVPATLSIEFRAEGRLRPSQPPAFVVPGVERSGGTWVEVHNAGPSGALRVEFSEKLPPPFLSAASEDPACRYDAPSRWLRCAWPRLDPGATLRAPIRFEARQSIPALQLGAELHVVSELGQSRSHGWMIISSGAVAGVQGFSPYPPSVYARLLDTVSLRMQPGIGLAGPAAARVGVPAQWQVRYSPGLRVLGVTPSAESSGMSCRCSDHSVTCAAPDFGSGAAEANATASIELDVSGVAAETAVLRWVSSYGEQEVAVDLPISPLPQQRGAGAGRS